MSRDKGKVLLDWKNQLTGVKFAFNGMNFFIDPADLDLDSGQCVDLANVDVDYKYNVSRRKGTKKIFGLTTHSLWAGDSFVYAVVDGYLAKLTIANESVSYEFIATTTQYAYPAEFKQINDVVVVSDGTTMAILDGVNGVTYTEMGVLGQNLSNEYTMNVWVASNFPADPEQWDGITSNSNFDVNAFKVDTRAGRCLEFYNGRLYFAVDVSDGVGGFASFIMCTEAFNITKTDIRYDIVAGFPKAVTMIARVSDGLYVGTEGSTYFLDGTGYHHDGERLVSGFSQRQVCHYPTARGTNVRLNATLVPDLKADDTCIMFTTSLGVFAGGNGGKYINLSAQQIAPPFASQGCALFKEQNNIYQYIVCFNSDPLCFSGTTNVLNTDIIKDTIVVNSINQAHSRYVNYVFNSFIRLGDSYYGSNVRGIYICDGDVDFLAESGLEANIDAIILTPITDMDKQETKSCSDAFLHTRQTGDLELDVIVNESELDIPPILIYYDGLDGIHRRRGMIPTGIVATDWQYRVRNVEGCDFTLFDLEIVAKTNQRVVSSAY